MNGQQTAHTLDRGNKGVLVVPILIALWFLNSFASQYLTLDRERFGIYWPRHEWLYVHVVAGMLALLLGPVQFWLGSSRRTTILHRILGGGYVLGVFVSGGTAFYLANHTDFGWVFGMGMRAMSIAWMISTAFATIAICLHLKEQHHEWMIRSYVLTFGFVTLRTMTQLLQMAGVGTILEQMAAAAWFSWSVPLLITEWVIQGRKILAAKRDLSKTKTSSHKSAQIELFETAPQL